jgi:peptide/nickel transport system ATP-binding protein
LLERLRAARGFACIFISHSLGVVEQIADRVVVLHRGRVVEEGSRDDIFDAPCHPYTCALLSAAPRLQSDGAGGYRLVGYEPDPPVAPAGYTYAPWRDADRRYDLAGDDEAATAPILVEITPGHKASLVPLAHAEGV